MTLATDQEIEIFFVSPEPGDASRLETCFRESRYAINVRWVRAHRSVDRDLCAMLDCQEPVLPSIVILSYDGLGENVWSVLRSVENSMNDRHVEFVVFGNPKREQDDRERPLPNVWVMPPTQAAESFVQ